MLPHFVQSIEGAATIGIVSLLASCVAFALILVWALRADKRYLDSMKQLPLDGPERLP